MRIRNRNMVSFAEFVLILNANEKIIINILKNHYQKSSSHSYAGVRYRHLIPHTVPYRGLSIPYRTVPPYFFFSQYRLVPVRYGTVRYGTDTAHRRSLICKRNLFEENKI